MVSKIYLTDYIDYELVLMDNASDDGGKTYEFFQSVPYKRKKIIQARGNMGSYFNAFRGTSTLWLHCGEYSPRPASINGVCTLIKEGK